METLHNQNAIKIQRWWHKNTSMKDLRKVWSYLNKSLTIDDLQCLANKCYAITKSCKGDGAGLASGGLIDMLICNFFKTKLTDYSDYHTGESDMKICDIRLSLKKISGTSDLALDWSKNEKNKKDNDKKNNHKKEKNNLSNDQVINVPQITKSQREHFSSHIMILNLQTAQWWKKSPIKQPVSPLIITYNDTIPTGIYLIDKRYCKYYIKLSSNNKTDTLIKKEYVYIMIKRSIRLDLFISLPLPKKDIIFNILEAFTKITLD